MGSILCIFCNAAKVSYIKVSEIAAKGLLSQNYCRKYNFLLVMSIGCHKLCRNCLVKQLCHMEDMLSVAYTWL